MRAFTDTRNSATPDEFWCLEHEPVFTQGQAGKPEHILEAGTIPIVASDRGGQITYHGPGQLVVYPLLDLRRRNMGVRQ
ncbi:MAG: lipoyl(octanoyl) transferase, partial [Moraxellaceae bacterium]